MKTEKEGTRSERNISKSDTKATIRGYSEEHYVCPTTGGVVPRQHVKHVRVLREKILSTR